MVTVGLSVTAAMAVIVESQHVKSTFTLEIKVKTRECTQQQSLSCSVEAAACCAACVELCLTFQMCLPSVSLYSMRPHVRMSISISVYVQ